MGECGRSPRGRRGSPAGVPTPPPRGSPPPAAGRAAAGGWRADFARRGRTIAVAIPSVLLCVHFRPLLLAMVWFLSFEALQEFHAMLRHIRLAVAGYALGHSDLPIPTSALHLQRLWHGVRAPGRRHARGAGPRRRSLLVDTAGVDQPAPQLARGDVHFLSTPEGKSLVGSLVAPLAVVSQSAFLAGTCLYFLYLVILTMFDQNACRFRAEQALRRYQEIKEKLGSVSPRSVEGFKAVSINPHDPHFAYLFLEAEMHLKAHFFEPQLLLTFLLEYVGFVWSTGLCWGVLLRCHIPGGSLVVFAVLVTNWATDIVALIVGRFRGRTPLYRAISPNKTREGSAAGIAASAALSVGCWQLFRAAGLRAHWSPYGAWVDAACFCAAGVAAGAAGVVGDLIESFFKRAARLKDTGSFFPGHGGVLDRVDGLLCVFPPAYCAALFLLPPSAPP